MQGCTLDTDHDGNCPIHPRGCPVGEVEDLTEEAVEDLEPTMQLLGFDHSRTAAAEAEAARLTQSKPRIKLPNPVSKLSDPDDHDDVFIAAADVARLDIDESDGIPTACDETTTQPYGAQAEAG